MDDIDWNEALLSGGDSELLWETFHENSKTSRFDIFPSNDAVVAEMRAMNCSLSFDSFPMVALPADPGLALGGLEDAIFKRVTAREMRRCPVTLNQLAMVLRCAYGVTRDNEGTAFPRPFRTIPSGGGLYPLEIFFHTQVVDGLPGGLYHYNASEHHVRLVQAGDLTGAIGGALVQPGLAATASVILFITAMFERTTFKYRDRGYRFVLLEAGHLGQNVNLVAGALGLGVVNIGGFFDRDIDRLLRLDGVTHSTVYMSAIGERLEHGPTGGP
jgi:SagB-type dehydrogenase family enzyme